MTLPAGETVIRWRAGTIADEYGNRVRSWDAATSTPIDGCGVAQGSLGRTDEVRAADSEGEPSDLTVYITDPEADVLATDRLEVRGRVYAIEGEPAAWANPMTGTAFGLVVRLLRVPG
ncbi:hypothetical protein AB0H43_03000 [Hamadaea sp. NPDC050747]|uniref:hypothetical protein n=1 Tax=Hamadaea sp. NPDC050747 TaxID=3155789 RepID=UPI0033D0AFD5